MVEFMVGDYIHRDKLKALLDKLFPGNWSAKVRAHVLLGFAHSSDQLITSRIALAHGKSRLHAS
jgi:hypothetical protein